MKYLYDYIIQHFTANDDLRPAMNSAHTQNAYVYASNAHTLIKVPAVSCEKKYHTDNAPNYEKFLSELDTERSRKKITTDELLKLFSAIHIRAQCGTKNCDKCEGEGNVICECCDNEADCKKCDGTGQLSDNNTVMAKSVWAEDEFGADEHYVMLNEHKTTPWLLELILFTMLAVGVKHATMINHGHNQLIFKVKDITILLMARK